MILKTLYEEYGFNIEALLVKEASRLELTVKELNVLLVLFAKPIKKKVLSINQIAKRLDYSYNDIAAAVEGLMTKDFLKISLESNNKREREVYELDGTFLKIEALLKHDELEKIKEQTSSNVGKTITLLEEKMGRMLKSNELERVRTWYETYKFNHDKIIDVINKTEKNISIIYLEKVLSFKTTEKTEIDQKTDEMLDKIFRNI
ncbi:MAG: DnaD domain protein [Acholeplasma sp.]|nr:DnaD domain protein [Acholeplasma sp.]